MKECDLVMKGGITSGVVYPYAITQLASTYRLRSIGGASAGAIAATLAASAEYRRQSGGEMKGFEEIEKAAGEIGDILMGLFQPSPALRPLYNMLIANLQAKTRTGKLIAMLKAAIQSFWLELLLIFCFCCAIMAASIIYSNLALGVLAGFAWLVASVTTIAMKLYRLIFVTLPKHDFGLCPGKTLQGKTPGFTDWIAEKVNEIAGLPEAKEESYKPLTIGHLKEKQIEIATITTDLSSSRPYQLPLKTDIHYFSKSEFQKLFSDEFVDYLCRDAKPWEYHDPDADIPPDLYQLPTGDKFPVLLVARLSLSFPGLIQAVPLWRIDYSRKTETNPAPLLRCLFSDGGISSNFPIHFFDAIIPSRPTFGIALTSLEKHHNGKRIHLPTRGLPSAALPISEIGGLGGFLMSIVNTAKDWQDTMQSRLPGYADRVVSVRLDETKEGGMNLTMDEETINNLIGYGEQAGETLLTKFSFDRHRYNRAVSVLPALAHELVIFKATYEAEEQNGIKPYSYVLTELPDGAYNSSSNWRLDVLDKSAEDLAKLGGYTQWVKLDESLRGEWHGGYVPSADSKIRLVAEADRTPRKTGSPSGQ